jgi:alpha-L-arabinofuranosidase
MKKELITAFCVLTMLASTAPIFAADTTTTTKTVVLTPAQILKLNATQTQLTALVAKIDSLKTTYKNTKDKGLLTVLNQYEKQAKTLNTTITNYKKNPTSPANIKIKTFQIKTKQLQYKVLVTAAILKKINTPKPIHPVNPIVPVHPVTPVKPVST